MSQKTIFWDFEGTLADRLGLRRSAVMEVLDVNEPGHHVDMEWIRPYLRDGFFWHRWWQPHCHLTTADAWWTETEKIFVRAYQGVGFEPNRAVQLAKSVRGCFVNQKRFVIPDDVQPTLQRLSELGWRHIIISNHVPELPDIVSALGLIEHVCLCLSSASTGYEKPNRQAYVHALAIAGNPNHVWMVSDNPDADVFGAEAAGIPAILVRTKRIDGVRHYASGLHEILLETQLAYCSLAVGSCDGLETIMTPSTLGNFARASRVNVCS